MKSLHTSSPLLISLFAVGIFFLSGCEALFIPPDTGNSRQEIFEEAWTFADQEYSFFEYKGVDWDEVRTRYEPQVREDMTDEEFFDLLAEMVYELRDGHVNLRSDFDFSRNWSVFLDSPPNYNYDVLERNYFLEGQRFTSPFIVYDFGDVGYLSYRSFSNGISGSSLNYVLEQFKDHDGIIIDIRNNGGGSLSNAYTFARRFAEDTVMFGRMRYKTGPGHEDFSALEEEFIEPNPDATRFLKPVVLLTNRSSYSASTFFTQMMREIPTVTVLGDTTGGGGGAPADTDLANGWVLRVSATQLYAPDGFNVEDGIPPDSTVMLRPEDEAQGIDTILEAALAFLRR